MEFEIDRRIWDRATFEHISQGKILTLDGKMCCLGFVSKQAGACENDMLEMSFPYEIFLYKRFDKKYIDTLNPAIKDFVLYDDSSFIGNSDFSNKASSINDNNKTTTQEKEFLLQNLFQKHGHNITFIN